MNTPMGPLERAGYAQGHADASERADAFLRALRAADKRLSDLGDTEAHPVRARIKRLLRRRS